MFNRDKGKTSENNDLVCTCVNSKDLVSFVVVLHKADHETRFPIFLFHNSMFVLEAALKCFANKCLLSCI